MESKIQDSAIYNNWTMV